MPLDTTEVPPRVTSDTPPEVPEATVAAAQSPETTVSTLPLSDELTEGSPAGIVAVMLATPLETVAETLLNLTPIRVPINLELCVRLSFVLKL